MKQVPHSVSTSNNDTSCDISCQVHVLSCILYAFVIVHYTRRMLNIVGRATSMWKLCILEEK